MIETDTSTLFSLSITLRTRNMSQQIAEQIRDAVREGRLLPGTVLPPVRVLAKEYEINHQTFLRAFRTLKQEGILESSQGGHVRIKAVRTASEILVVFDIASFGVSLSPGYRTYLHRLSTLPVLQDVTIAGKQPIPEVRLMPFFSTPEIRDDFLDSPIVQRLDSTNNNQILGILFIGYAASRRILKFLEAKKVACVGVGSTGQYSFQTQIPILDFIRFGVACAEKHKARRVGFIYPTAPDGKDFLPCFFRAMCEQASLECRHEWIHGIQDAFTERGQNIFRGFLENAPEDHPDFIVVADDMIALGIIREVQDRGLRIPDDYGIVSLWNQQFAPAVPFDFPRAVINANELFDKSLELLLDILAGRRTKPTTIYAAMQINS